MATEILMPPTIQFDGGTLTHQPPADLNPSSDQALLSALAATPYTFLQPPPSLHTAALILVKRYLDPLATSISRVQHQRLQAVRRKRKRGDDDSLERDVLRLRQIHLESFGIEQIWEQTRRILESSRQEVERSIPVDDAKKLNRAAVEGNELSGATKRVKLVRFDNEGFEIGSGLEDEDSDGGEDSESGMADGDMDDDLEKLVPEDGESDLEVDEPGGAEDIEVDTDEETEPQANDPEVKVLVPDKFGLNDGFFSIEDFNRTSELLEQQDAQGDSNDGIDSDEEDWDWDADPMALTLRINGKTDIAKDDNDSDGPTFGNADLNAPFSDDDDVDSTEALPMEDAGIANTNDIKYDDFFAPPARPAKISTRKRPLPKTQPTSKQETDDEVQRTISAVRRDLFEDELSNPSDQEDDPSNQNGPLSSHEKRQSALRSQILSLEAASVSKREWQLSGEARAAERPINSLLEQDLDFERAGKPVPVITAAISEDIESLIKRRILAREFDEVIKRRPGSGELTAPEARRGRAELDDTKSGVGLAELYEDQHLREFDPGYVDKRDKALKEQHEAIERAWKEVSGKLDALSSWHHRPKPAEVKVSVVENIGKISLEDARPAGVVGVGGDQGRLAPQEIFTIGEKEHIEDRVVAGGEAGVVARDEMSREQKVRRRRREKERIRKSGKEIPNETTNGKTGKVGRRVEERGVLNDLKKGGVMVIGKRGEVVDVEGKKTKFKGEIVGGSGFKL